MDQKRMENAVRELLCAMGENPDREGLLETPARVARMYAEICGGLTYKPEDDIKIFHVPECDEMVVVKDIPFYSLCEHHLLPFFGAAHVAYIPRDGKILGLSKIARLVDGFAKKPQVQERLTAEVADMIEKAVDARGVAVLIEAEHLCMTMRGIKKPGSKTVTSALRGAMRTDIRTRNEAMAILKD